MSQRVGFWAVALLVSIANACVGAGESTGPRDATGGDQRTGTGGAAPGAGGSPVVSSSGGRAGSDLGTGGAGMGVAGSDGATGVGGAGAGATGGRGGGPGTSGVGGTVGAGGRSGTGGTTAPPTDPSASCPGGKAAFPGAQGPAGCASGGRAGDVYHVTNLADDALNPTLGSLRYGLAHVPAGGRTIVFDVAGTIQLNPPGRAGWLGIAASNVTIAGQTAPAPGITIMGAATKITGTNVIVRHLKFRPGQDRANPGISTNDALWIEGKNVIVDHLSNSWSDDELLSITDLAEQVTVQYSLLVEGLEYALVAGNEAGKGHSMGGIIGSDVSDTPIAIHHTIYAHSGTRNPRYGSEVGTGSINDFAENVVYDWISNCGYAGLDQVYKGNLRNNYYIAGKSTTQTSLVFLAAGVAGQLFFGGNVADMNKNGVFDGSAAPATMVSGTYTHVNAPFALIPGTLDSPQTALTKTLAQAGAFYWARDLVDSRVVNEIKTGTGSIPLLPATAEWNALWNATTPIRRPAGFDTDNDGMPNAWETTHALDPNDASDAKTLNGTFTNLENYLNAAAAGAGYP